MNSHAKVDPRLHPDEAIDHIRGPASAPVTVIEYGDFECPSCVQAHGAVAIMPAHFANQVRFVFRHFPLREVHPHAELGPISIYATLLKSFPKSFFYYRSKWNERNDFKL